MPEWERVQLGEFCDVRSGFAFTSKDWQDEGVPVVKIQNVRNGRVSLEGCAFVSEAVADSASGYELRYGDVLITMSGEIGAVGKVRSRNRLLLNQRVGCFKIHEPGLIDEDYFFAVLQVPSHKSWMEQVSYGAAQPNISPDLIKQLEIPLPPLPEQRAIGGLSEVINDLIENNRRRIELLEETARLLYREWFVNFQYPGYEDVPLVESELGLIPEGWEVGVLGDVADEIRNSVKPSPETQLMPYVPIDAISPKQITLGKKRPGTEAKSSLRHFKTGDVLFGAMRAYFHKVAQAPFEGLTRSTCFVLRPHLGRYYFTLMKLADETTVAFAAANSTGSTIPYAHWDGVLSQMETVIPPEEVAGDFGEIIRPLLEICQALTQQGELLRETRDLLLPRLVSGDLDISGLELDLEAVG